MSIRRWKIRLATGIVAALAVAAPSIGQAGPQDRLCSTQETHGPGQSGDGRSDLCPQGQAACIAIGAYVRVEPNAALPGGATVQLSRSEASAFAGSWRGYGYGQGHGDAAQAKADVPPALGAGAVESRCDAFSMVQQDEFSFGWNHADGEADISRFSIDLATYGVPVSLTGDVLHEKGASDNGAGGNGANIVDLSGSVYGTPIGPIAHVVAPNTVIPLGPATLYLNEQGVGGFFCPTYYGDALRLVVTDPLTGSTVATVILSWVANTTCPM